MGSVRRRVALLGLWSCAAAVPALHAAPLIDAVTLVRDASVANVLLPQDANGVSAETFTVSQPGAYTITVTDLNTPAALSSLSVTVATPAAAAATLGTAGTSASRTVTLTAGTYTVQTLATAATGSLGSFNVSVVAQGGSTPLFTDNWTVSPPSTPNTGESTLSSGFTVTDGGSYQLALTDLTFPNPLQSLQVIVLPHGGTTPVAGTPVSLGGTLTSSVAITLAPGVYDLFAFAQANATGLQGLFSLQVSGGSSTSSVAFAVTSPVGTLAAAAGIPVPSAESVQLQVADTAFPAALSSLQAVVTQGASVLQSYTAAATASFAAQATSAVSASDPVALGLAQVFVAATPNSGAGMGAYALYASDSANTLLDTAVPVVSSGATPGYAFSTSLSSAGSYMLNLNDYAYPAALGSLSAVVAQKGAALVTATSSSTTTPLSASLSAASGSVTVVVFPVLGSGTSAGLFGLNLQAQPSMAIVYEATQGIGVAFTSTALSLPASTSYLLNAADLGFPANMSTLAVLVTHGSMVAAKLFGGASAGNMPFSGNVEFTTSNAGTYVVNVLAQPGTGAHYGLYGMTLDVAPPAPAVTLTASASSVTSGQAAMLSWSSTNATTCTASGGWSGTLGPSGSQSTGALTAGTTFNLTCTGAGGTGNATVNIEVAAPTSASHGGGGALGLRELYALLAAVIATQWRRRIVAARGN